MDNLVRLLYKNVIFAFESYVSKESYKLCHHLFLLAMWAGKPYAAALGAFLNAVFIMCVMVFVFLMLQ